MFSLFVNVLTIAKENNRSHYRISKINYNFLLPHGCGNDVWSIDVLVNIQKRIPIHNLYTSNTPPLENGRFNIKNTFYNYYNIVIYKAYLRWLFLERRDREPYKISFVILLINTGKCKINNIKM